MDILVTKRLTLRTPLEVDAETIAEGLSNFNVSRMLAPVPHPYTLDDARAFIAEKIKNPEPCLYTVHRNRLIGSVGVHDRDKGPMLGYWFAENVWGNGYATEAARAVLARAFRYFDCDVIRSQAFSDNDASLRVMDKLGFEQVGTGIHFNKARNEELPDVQTELQRSTFERRFGPLEQAQAA